MKNNRKYLVVPGQRIDIRIEGDTAVGKTQLSEKIVAMAQADGLLAHQDEGLGFNKITITCPTEREARDMYLETLNANQRETLIGHLGALGYEL